MNRFRLVVCALSLMAGALGVPVAVSAQDVVTTLTPDKPFVHKAGTKVDLYRFVAVMGTNVIIKVTAPGPVIATLYTVDGAQLLQTEGKDRIWIDDAYLPASGAYTVSVVRARNTKPYSIELSASTPTLTEVFLSWATGYEYDDAQTHARAYQCWVRPGHEVRVVGVTSKRTSTREADDSFGNVYTDPAIGDVVLRYKTALAFTDEDLIATTTFPSSKIVSTVVDLAWSPLTADTNPKWHGYLCPDD